MRYLLILLVFLLLNSSCEDNKTQKNQDEKSQSVNVDTIAQEEVKKEKPAERGTLKNPIISSQAMFKDYMYAYGKENPETKIRIETRFGNIEVRLFKDTPLHRANFIHLVKREYFNTTQFHRVSPEFVIQGGNNDTQGTARNRASMGKYLIPSEAKYKHTRGAFSASKYSEQNISKASHPFEFFIVQSRNGAHHLDGEHTVFGRVTKGMNVVDKINSLEVDGTEWPLENVYMKVVIIE